ncbi:MAG TPA: hypothetical protein VFL77_04360 [Solirubrobacterales bacterium]|nr:hypothetical protein [Solirubrobacterales bacterium]
MESEKSVPELFKKLEDLGVSKHEVERYLREGDADRAREGAAPLADPLEEIGAKLDRLQDSVDALATKLERS